MTCARGGISWLVLGALLMAPGAAADTLEATESYSAAITTRFPLPFPSGSVSTTFTSYTGAAFPFFTRSFFVGTTGSFSATVSGIGSGVGVFVLRGTFAPSSGSDPTTLLSDVLAGTQAPATIPSVSLMAGERYSFLVVISSGSGTGTVTLEGLGCIRLDSSCATFVPLSTRVTSELAALLDALSGSASGDLATAVGSLSALGPAQQTRALERLLPVPAHALALTTRAALTSALDQVGGRLEAVRADARSRTGLRYAGLASARPLASVGTAPHPRSHRDHLWLTSYGLSGRRGDAGPWAGHSSNGWGTSFGADRSFGPGLVAGVALSYSAAELSYHNQRSGDRSGVRSRQLSLYGSRDLSHGFAEAMLTYGQQRYDARRHTTVNGVAEGDFDGSHWGVRLGGGVPLRLARGIELTPRASLEWTRIRQDAYREDRGGPLALRVGSSTARRLRSRIGVELSRDSDLGRATLRPYLRGFWQRDLSDDGVDSAARFVGGGPAFTAPGQPLERDSYTAGAGVQLFAGEGLSTVLGYDATLGKDHRTHVLQLSVRGQF